MKKTSRRIVAPLASLILLVAGTSFFMTFITVRLELTGSSDWIIGLMHSSFFAGLLVGAYLIEKGLQQIGHIRAYGVMAGTTVVSIVSMGLFPIPLLWAIARFVAGFCIASHFVIIESWLLSLSTKSNRGQILALYNIALYLSQAVSQFIINMVNVLTTQAYLASALLVSLSILPITSTRKPQPEIVKFSQFSVIKLLWLSPFGVIGCFFSGMMISCAYSFMPSFATKNNLPIALTVFTLILGGVVLQWPFGKASDQFDRRYVLFFLGLFLSLPPTIILFFDLHRSIIFFLIFLLGGIIFTIYPLSLAQVCDRLGNKNLTGISSLLLLVFGVGSTVGPVTAPLVFQFSENMGLMLYFILMSGLLTLVGLVNNFFFKEVSRKDHHDYEPLVHLNPVVYELDVPPR